MHCLLVTVFSPSQVLSSSGDRSLWAMCRVGRVVCSCELAGNLITILRSEASWLQKCLSYSETNIASRGLHSRYLSRRFLKVSIVLELTMFEGNTFHISTTRLKKKYLASLVFMVDIAKQTDRNKKIKTP